jgi:hypothetical protein
VTASQLVYSPKSQRRRQARQSIEQQLGKSWRTFQPKESHERGLSDDVNAGWFGDA